MKKSLFRIQIGAFTTNETSYSPIDLVTLFSNNFKCQNVIKKGSKRLDFLFDLSSTQRCASSVLYIKDFEEDYPLCHIVDCYMALIDLEADDQRKVEEVVSYVTTYCQMEKKIYVLGLFKDKEKLKLDEKSITSLLNEKMLFYEYKQINSGDMKEVVSTFEDIYNDSIESVTENIKHSMVEISLARSGGNGHSCSIF